MAKFEIKSSGEMASFDSGMVRDKASGKVRYHRVATGPMLKRWGEHLHKGNIKYPDVAPGVSNWTLAAGPEELQRFRESAWGHFMSWWEGQTDEDHAAALFFNVNGVEFTREKLDAIDPKIFSSMVSHTVYDPQKSYDAKFFSAVEGRLPEVPPESVNPQ
jgi:hypothetical protein